MKLSLKKSFIAVIAACSLTACVSKGNFTDMLKNYTGSDASTIYLYDDNTHEYSLVTYSHNDKDKCYEKINDEQLTILRRLLKSETMGMNKFTIKPDKKYAIKSIGFDKWGAYITSIAFIPEANKSYFLNSSSGVVEVENNAEKVYLNRLAVMKYEETKNLPQPKAWPIKNNTCSNFLTGRL